MAPGRWNVIAVPRLSIGLPVCNGENYLTESLDALLGQTYTDFELIISDNASTDSTRDICLSYARADSRIRYFHQPQNIGIAPNRNFVTQQASGELFKVASHDDLYARDLLRLCIEALDEHPRVVLAHSWSANVDSSGTVTELLEYPVNTAASRAPDRFRSMLFDGWGDDDGGVIRMDVLRRVTAHGSYHFADRTFTAEIALYGPFYMVPDWLFFRRCHPGQAGGLPSVRERCARLDPRRANHLTNPAARLYAEYIWGYIRAIRRAPMAPSERRECYRLLAQWATGRALPVAARALSGQGLRTDRQPGPTAGAAVDELAADRGRAPGERAWIDG
jgi:glycosyltransferase involved in cell wall biosynthesis